ncbi:hypothetical protein [Microbacterium sp. Root53]|uniref:hypothetical protein n=1 Tax=Microbacterium sp. Root53 TaxID=1736553 RepID=UPI0006FDB275|nr:hypothetical protein [Microbacterium sp. Root53]KQY98506.1 hypothetical protein ASD19_06610 [Microbacterium sp. Root53]
MNYIHGYDTESLREIVDPVECARRLDEIGHLRSLPAMLEQVWLLKVLGRLDESLPLSEQAVRLARMSGTRKDLLRARILHASVNHWLGKHAAAEAELSTCIDEALGQSWNSIAAFALSHRGKNRYDAGDIHGARADFKQTLFLRQESGASDEELEPVMQCIEAADRRRHQSAIA